MNKKRLRLLHYPQVPCKPFIVEVADIEEAKKIYDTLNDYDLFQFNNKIKPDYANMTLLEQYNEINEEWEDWVDDETGVEDFEEYLEMYYDII